VRRTLRLTATTLAIAGLFSVGVASRVAAVVDAADYAVWRFPSPGPRGIGIIHEGASSTTLVAEVVGLNPSSGYRYVGSSAFCGDIHQPLNALWLKSFQSNAKGAAYVSSTIDDGALTPGLRSIRLFKGDTQADCAKPTAYESGAGGSQPRDAFAMISAYGTRLLILVDMSTGNDRVTAAGHRFIESHGYRLVGSSAACPSQPTGSTTLFEKSGTTNSLGILWRDDTGTNFGSSPPRSIQLFSPSGRVACARTTILPAVQ
jgi:hypothetical protein